MDILKKIRLALRAIKRRGTYRVYGFFCYLWWLFYSFAIYAIIMGIYFTSQANFVQDGAEWLRVRAGRSGKKESILDED